MGNYMTSFYAGGGSRGQDFWRDIDHPLPSFFDFTGTSALKGADPANFLPGTDEDLESQLTPGGESPIDLGAEIKRDTSLDKKK